MPISWKAFDREEEDIERRLQQGLISNEQARKERRELQRDYRDAIDEEAEQAARYSREENGGW